MPRHGLPTPGDLHEKIIGPVLGHYLACYAVREAGGYHGYAKVCTERPLDVWDTPQACGKVASGLHPEPERALAEAVTRARRQLELGVDDTLWCG